MSFKNCISKGQAAATAERMPTSFVLSVISLNSTFPLKKLIHFHIFLMCFSLTIAMRYVERACNESTLRGRASTIAMSK